MNKRMLITGAVVGSIVLGYGIAKAGDERQRQRLVQLEQKLNALPDSVFEGTQTEDLLEHDVYRILAAEGWTREEIMTIMSTALKDRAAAKQKSGYIEYTKGWLPDLRSDQGDVAELSVVDPLDPAAPARVRAAVANAGEIDLYNKIWPEQIPYTPEDRLAGIRRPGYFRPMLFKPACGRTNWAEVNPENEDQIMIIPDGGGIMRTDDYGKHWRCITDNIPERAYRESVNGYSIPVDPTDWNHVFAFMNGGVIWETFDGGETWTKIEGARHYGFKRGRCIRDAQGNLRLIGCYQSSGNTGVGGNGSSLMISEDKGKTWTTVQIPEEMKDPVGGNAPGLWFQQVEYDPHNRDMIYLPTGRSIMYFDDGARPTVNPDGSKTYHIKKLNCEVYGFNIEGTPRNADDPSRFPFPGNGPGNMVIDGNVPGRMWYLATNSSQKDALFYTEDGGRRWRTILDTDAGINGGSRLYGGESGWTWLGGFGVNVKDAPYKAYATTLNTGYTTGDYTAGEAPAVRYTSWVEHLNGRNDDGTFSRTTSVGHNSDNHCIISHPRTGRIYRGNDAGFYSCDPDINGGNWFNIGNNGEWTLFYAMCTNEFGDQCVIGNTQDINVQTYYYGRWGEKNGYEGSHCSINPFTNTGYYSANGTEGFENAAQYMQNNSWQSLMSRADVTTGAWFLRHDGNPNGFDFERFDDYGRSATALRDNVGDRIKRREWGICRDNGISTIYVVNNSGKILRSTDSGTTFQNVMAGSNQLGWSGPIAVDPDDSNTLYLATRGRVVKWNVAAGRGEDLPSAGLPSIDCHYLLFHEGSGDLYYCNGSDGGGIYILEKGADRWRFWVKGRNSSAMRDVHINYTTQEIICCTWGHGMWAADLEHPCDRFYRPGFALTERSHVDGRRTIGIDTEWTVPHYHTYRWWVNDAEVENPYPYLTRKLNAGDRVRLELSLRESPDVHTMSSEFTVADTPDQPLQRRGGNALYSDGGGRIDLGNQEWFNKDFTVELWLNPESNGAVIGNRQKNVEQGSRGWLVFIENGRLYLRYAPRNRYFHPTYESGEDLEGVRTHDLGSVAMNKWNHIALTCSLTDGFKAYVNGNLQASVERWQPERDINNSVNLCLLGDGNDWNGLRGAVDELKIWTRALDRDEIRTELYSTNINDREGLAAYYDFNGTQPLPNFTDLVVTGRSPLAIGRERLGDRRAMARSGAQPAVMHEAFSGQVPMSRIRAVTSAVPSLAVLHADKAALASVGADAVALTAPDGTGILSASQQGGADMELGAYRYDTEQWITADGNLDPAYYDICSSGYVIRSFGAGDIKADATVEFFAPEGQPFNPHRGYRLYSAEIDGAKPYWVRGANLVCDQTTGRLVYTGPLSDIEGRKLIIVAPKAGIEVTVSGVDNHGRVRVYDERSPYIHITARAVEGIAEPDGRYEIASDNGLLTPVGALQFTKGVAELDLKVDMTRFTEGVTSLKTVVRSLTDSKMIPLELEVVNSVTSRTIGTSTTVVNGGLQVGTAEDWACLNGSTEFTMMAWMRVDDMPFSGQRPFMLFNNGAQRIGYYSHDSGWVRGFYNSEAWLQNNASNHDISPYKGKWVHIAYVARKTGVDLYMNGVCWSRGNTLTPAVITSPLYLGQMGGGDTWFSGAFDQVSVWKRSLGGDEIVKYMQERVALDAPGLLAYLTMDESVDGKLVERVSGMTVSERGTVSHHTPSVMPYDGRNRYSINSPKTDKVLSFAFPDNGTRYGYVTTFDGQPYGYHNSERSDLIPLGRESYTLVYTSYYRGGNTYTEPGSTMKVTVTYRHPSIIAGEAVTMGVRPLGNTDAITTFAEATSVADGVATFSVPYTSMVRACDIMFFSPVDAARRESRVELSVDETLDADGRKMLREGDNSLTFTARLVAGTPDQPVELYVKEPYAVAATPTIDFSASSEVKFEVNLDRSKMDSYGLNPVTVGVIGVQGGEASATTYIEPYVELSLRGVSADGPATHYATTAVTSLDVEARHVEGWMPSGEAIRLNVTADNVASQINAGSGSLMANHPVDITGLEYDPSTQRCQHQGLNLVGNPFLTNINLTRADNVSYDADRLTKFVYQCDPATGNYRVYDMTVYEQTQMIKPFQAYFVQTMAHDAVLTVSPRAKTTTRVSHKERTSVYEAVGVSAVTLQLLRDGAEADRTDLRIGEGAAEFNLGEDAPKLWSLDPTAAQICLFTAATPDDHASEIAPAALGDVVTRVNVPTAVNACGSDFSTSPVGLRIGRPGDYELRISGAELPDGQSLYILDAADGSKIPVATGEEGVKFTVTPEMLADGPVDLSDRFSLGREGGDVSGAVAPGHGCEVTVEGSRVTVSGLSGDATIRIYQPNGISVCAERTSGAAWSTTLALGVYLVRIIQPQTGESIAKIAVK